MKKILFLVLIFMNFIGGFYAGMMLKEIFDGERENAEIPQGNELLKNQITAPYDRIQEKSISVYNDKIIIDLGDLQGKTVSWATYADSKSMIPTIGKGCNGLEFVPTSPAEVHRGDMIAFTRKDALIIHRVIDVGSDEYGWFVKTKGDNNQFLDEKVRFSQIKFITFGVIC